MDARQIIEALLLASSEPLAVDQLASILADGGTSEPDEVRRLLAEIEHDWTGRPLELVENRGAYRLRIRQCFSPWVARLDAQRTRPYSRAVLETLAIIAYRQPVTRAEIEDIRGVAVGTGILRTLQDRGWIRILGHRQVPGRPALFGTTTGFLDDFDLATLDQLPVLPDLQEAADHATRNLDSPDSLPSALTPEQESKPGTMGPVSLQERI